MQKEYTHTLPCADTDSRIITVPPGFNILAISLNISAGWNAVVGVRAPQNTTSNDELAWSAEK